jgi:hypothetical protein
VCGQCGESFVSEIVGGIHHRLAFLPSPPANYLFRDYRFNPLPGLDDLRVIRFVFAQPNPLVNPRPDGSWRRVIPAEQYKRHFVVTGAVHATFRVRQFVAFPHGLSSTGARLSSLTTTISPALYGPKSSACRQSAWPEVLMK